MGTVMLDIAIILSVVIAGLFLWLGPARRSLIWRAMTTPLASIIGSGFLILGPVLIVAYGMYAPIVMMALCAVAFGFGAAIRYNIQAVANVEYFPAPSIVFFESLASWVLGFAYIISVAYYLNLLGAFGVSLTRFDDAVYAKVLTTTVYLIIVTVGWISGFKSLERMEYFTVSAKLAIIVGLLVGLSVYFVTQTSNGGLVYNAPDVGGWPAVTLAFGLIVTVQGFETSRYLLGAYDAPMCVRSMRWAQGVSAVIYMIYILLLTYVFAHKDLVLSETGIIDMMAIVAPVLPPLLVAAALCAQFSAAVADTSGSGGLISEVTRNRVTPRIAYVVLVVTGIGLTWISDIFAIVSYASRAFAAYYAIQSIIAAIGACRRGQIGYCVLYSGFAVLGFLIFVFGEAIEAK